MLLLPNPRDGKIYLAQKDTEGNGKSCLVNVSNCWLKIMIDLHELPRTFTQLVHDAPFTAKGENILEDSMFLGDKKTSTFTVDIHSGASQGSAHKKTPVIISRTDYTLTIVNAKNSSEILFNISIGHYGGYEPGASYPGGKK